jgi:hypothetical protein
MTSDPSIPLDFIRNHHPDHVAHWLYTEHGRLVMIVARYHDYKGVKTYRQFHLRDDGWAEGMPPKPYPLYGLDSLKNWSPSGTIFIAEGEKTTSVLHQLGWPAVTSALGARNVHHSDFNPLRLFSRFLILRDNDAAGAQYACEIAVAISRIREDPEISVCNLTPDIPSGDLVDWIQQRPLYGHHWDGISNIAEGDKAGVARALTVAIEQTAQSVATCPEIGFKPELILFDGEPRSLEEVLKEVPNFPQDALPDCLAHYALFSSRHMAIPIDFPATILLGLLGGSIGRTTLLDMRPGNRWFESANVWSMLVGRPSSKKSPTLRRMCQCIQPLEERALKDHAAQMADYKHRKAQAKKDDVYFDEEPPRLRRQITDDASIPKLRELLSQNPRGLILRSDELKGQLEKLDREGNEGDRSFIMQCWAGLDFYNEDRIGRGSTLRIPLTLTWIGCIPPAKLSFYLSQATSDIHGGDGLMQRFQMAVYPDFHDDFVICREPLSSEVEQAVHNIFAKLDEEALLADRILRFSSEAQQAFDAWHTDIENDNRKGGHPEYWESHRGKLPKLLAALCIILHRANEVITGIKDDEVSATTLRDAQKLVHYYEAHALRCYESVETVAVTDARKIMKLIQQKKIESRFKAVDIYSRNLSGLRSPERVNAGLQVLKEAGWIALDRRKGTIGRPSEEWVSHPSLTNKY